MHTKLLIKQRKRPSTGYQRTALDVMGWGQLKEGLQAAPELVFIDPAPSVFPDLFPGLIVAAWELTARSARSRLAKVADRDCRNFTTASAQLNAETAAKFRNVRGTKDQPQLQNRQFIF
jgi:hypothetical protein